MRIVISALAILFGGLHIIAAGTQLKSEDAAARGLSIAMLCGGIAVICAAVIHLMGGLSGWQDVISAVTGCLLICVSAYENGRRSGNLHPAHHIVRGAVAALLVAGFAIW